jgi:hypothetical protein
MNQVLKVMQCITGRRSIVAKEANVSIDRLDAFLRAGRSNAKAELSAHVKTGRAALFVP